MKQIKNAWLLVIGSFLVMATIIISCSKKGTAPPSIPKPTITSITPSTAYPGDTVTITGTNLTGATSVTFGGTPAAAYTVVSATSVKAKLGAGAAGAVNVVTPGGTASFTGFTFNTGLPPVDGYSSSNDIETASLIAYWPFDGNTTESVHSKNPVLTGGPAATFVAGKLGQAVHLEAGFLTYGSDATSVGADNTTFGSNDTLQNGFTLSLWTQAPFTDPLEPAGLSTLFQLSSPNIPNWPLLGIQFRKHNGDSSFDFNGGFSNVDGSGPHLTYAGLFQQPSFKDTAAWALLSMTYDGSNKSLKYYANGQLVNTIDLTTVGGAFPDLTASLLVIAPNYPTIGAAESKNTTPGSSNDPASYMAYAFTGNIDDIRFYNKTLTAQQISDLFVLGNQGR
jgi:hypothetical protein